MNKMTLFFVLFCLFSFLVSSQNPDFDKDKKLLSYNSLPHSTHHLIAHPSKFAAYIDISFKVSYKTNVRLTVFDVNGKLITQIKNSETPKGNYNMQWNGTNNAGAPVQNGVYIIQLQAGELRKTSKVLFKRE